MRTAIELADAAECGRRIEDFVRPLDVIVADWLGASWGGANRVKHRTGLTVLEAVCVSHGSGRGAVLLRVVGRSVVRWPQRIWLGAFGYWDCCTTATVAADDPRCWLRLLSLDEIWTQLARRSHDRYKCMMPAIRCLDATPSFRRNAHQLSMRDWIHVRSRIRLGICSTVYTLCPFTVWTRK